MMIFMSAGEKIGAALWGLVKGLFFITKHGAGIDTFRVGVNKISQAASQAIDSAIKNSNSKSNMDEEDDAHRW